MRMLETTVFESAHSRRYIVTPTKQHSEHKCNDTPSQCASFCFCQLSWFVDTCSVCVRPQAIPRRR